MRKIMLPFLLSLLLVGCGAPIKHDPTAFIVDPATMDPIPDVCRESYKVERLKVAVANFGNNTTFEFAKMVQSQVQGSGQRTAVGAAGVAATPRAAGLVWGSREQTQFQVDAQTTERQVNAKLAESVEDGVVDELLNMGGATIFTRRDMEKIMAEQQFQASGLVDDKTLVNMGQLAGVRLLVTGSINNVNLTWQSMEEARRGARQLGIAGALIAAGLESQEGWNITTDVALRIIDVETGQVQFSRVVSGREVIGKTPYPSYDALVGGIKRAAQKALAGARPQLSKWFTVRGYILQTRTSPDKKERSALINLGEKDGVKAGVEFFVYTFQEISDPFDPRKRTCDIVRLPVILRVTEQIQADKAWLMITGEPGQVARVRLGQLVERKPVR